MCVKWGLIGFIVLGLLEFSGVEGKTISHSNNVHKPKFSIHISKPIDNTPIFDNASNGPTCKSLIAYYTGTLQNKKRPNEYYNVEFQVKIWADEIKKKIHVYADKWNEKFSKSGDFELDFYYDTNRQWCEIYDNDCSSLFGKKDSTFKLDINNEGGNFFHLLSFNHFNNSFTLNQPIDQCAKNKLDGASDDNTPDLNKLTFCVCCGDDYEPNVLLGCPSDTWNQPTTQKPKPKPTVPQPKDTQCKSLVGYYRGHFLNSNNPHTAPNVEFQIRLNANDQSKKVSVVIDKWNSRVASTNDFSLRLEDYEKTVRCPVLINNNCFIPYASKEEPYFYVEFLQYNSDGNFINEYDFLTLPKFNNTFVLTKTIGQCTRNQLQSSYEFTPDTTLYDYCLCCGSEYKPDPSLGCPKNPWA